MIKTKLFEIRDQSTFIPCFAIDCRVDCQPFTEYYLLRRAGYGDTPCVLFGRLDGGAVCYDPYDWPASTRTMREAHHYIAQNFDNLETGSVIDVEFILNETTECKKSERFPPTPKPEPVKT